MGKIYDDNVNDIYYNCKKHSKTNELFQLRSPHEKIKWIQYMFGKIKLM